MSINNLSRRDFLSLVGAAGGSTAIYQTSLAMGMMTDTGKPANLNLKQVKGERKSVLVLGAGVSGLTVAYELERAGYKVTVLEAAKRIGGRNMTLRHGDEIDELGQKQICHFDDNPKMYFNAGPARIPGHHQRVLHYCKTLQVPLQIKSNFSRPAYTHETDHFDGKPVRMSRYVADARGFLSELLHKAVDQSIFDESLSGEEIENLRQFVRRFGDLKADGSYQGSIRGGLKSGGYLEPAESYEPMELKQLLNSNFWRGGLTSSENPDWGDPLMEITGGMDGLIKAFIREIRSKIMTNAQVQSIKNSTNGVEVEYHHRGKRKQLKADWCFNSIPSHFISSIPNNFADDYVAGLTALERGNFFKIGFQMKSRFWENEGIYGGITQTNQRINQIWYPSTDIHSEKGVVLGAYAFYKQSEFFEKLTPSERLNFAADCGEKIHPGYKDQIEAGVSIPWGRMNHMMGCGARWPDEVREKYWHRLRLPEGYHYMIGDQISYHSSWQEGAFASAEFALQDMDQRVRANGGAMHEGLGEGT